jgi:hypothetical protein
MLLVRVVVGVEGPKLGWRIQIWVAKDDPVLVELVGVAVVFVLALTGSVDLPDLVSCCRFVGLGLQLALRIAGRAL